MPLPSADHVMSVGNACRIHAPEFSEISAWENRTEMIMPIPGIEAHVLILAQYSRAIAGPGATGLCARL
jgi:hypothetical protein